MTTTLPPPETTPPPPAGPAPAPRLADGIELIGLFEDSGFKEPPYIARRADGQVVQMPAMLYALAEQIDGERSIDAIAEAFSHRIERAVPADMAEELIDTQLRPLGIVAAQDGEPHELKRVDPLLALKFRAAVIPDRAVHGITTVFKPLFLPPVLALALAAFVGLDAWLFFVHGISQSLRHTLYNPALMLALLGGVVLATAFHEIGHATAVRYGGAKPGVMGAGIYIVWPAFYTDITDSYRLGKWGRLRTDIGGMYFNAIFALAIGAAYALTSFEPLLLLVVIQTFAIIQQSLPFLRLDGYYIISDLTGVPDILTRIKPVLASLVPGRKRDDRVDELKPWVRRVVTAYIALLVPLIGLMFTLMVINAPRLFGHRLGLVLDALRRRRARIRQGPDLERSARGNPDGRAGAAGDRVRVHRHPDRRARRHRRLALVGREPREARRRDARRHRRGGRSRVHVVAERRVPADPAR